MQLKKKRRTQTNKQKKNPNKHKIKPTMTTKKHHNLIISSQYVKHRTIANIYAKVCGIVQSCIKQRNKCRHKSLTKAHPRFSVFPGRAIYF